MIDDAAREELRHRQLTMQVPTQLPLQVRLTPERETVIWFDGFRRWRGGLSFDVRLLTGRRDPSLSFESHDDMAVADNDMGLPRRDRIDVRVTVDGRELRASRGEIEAEGRSWSGDGRASSSWFVPMGDEPDEAQIRLHCETLPLHSIIEPDCDMLRSALDDVWELDPDGRGASR